MIGRLLDRLRRAFEPAEFGPRRPAREIAIEARRRETERRR